MKKDIKQVGYMDTNSSGNWWVWNEYCDICGRQTRNYNVIASEKPKEEEKDYCIPCMQAYLDELIKNKQ